MTQPMAPVPVRTRARRRVNWSCRTASGVFYMDVDPTLVAELLEVSTRCTLKQRSRGERIWLVETPMGPWTVGLLARGAREDA